MVEDSLLIFRPSACTRITTDHGGSGQGAEEEVQGTPAAGGLDCAFCSVGDCLHACGLRRWRAWRLQ